VKNTDGIPYLLSVIKVPAESTNDDSAIQVVIHTTIKIIHWPNKPAICSAFVVTSAALKIKPPILIIIMMSTAYTGKVIIRLTLHSDRIIIWIHIACWITTGDWFTSAFTIVAVDPVFFAIIMPSPHTWYGLTIRTHKIVVLIKYIARAWAALHLLNNTAHW